MFLFAKNRINISNLLKFLIEEIALSLLLIIYQYLCG